MNRYQTDLKKGVTLAELLVGVAVFGLFIVALYFVFRGGVWWSYRTQTLNEVQQSASLLMDHLTWDIRGAYSFQACSGSDLRMQVFCKAPSGEYAHDPTLLVANPSVEDVVYHYDASNETVTRSIGGREFRYTRVKDFQVQGYEIAEPDFPLSESNDLDRLVAVGIRLWVQQDARHHDEDQDIEILSLVYSKSRLLLKMFGTQSQKYGYFSSLEDASF